MIDRCSIQWKHHDNNFRIIALPSATAAGTTRILLCTVMLLVIVLCSEQADARTKFVLNLDVWTWDKVVTPGRDVVVKFDVEWPHGEEQEAFKTFAEAIANASVPPLVAEVRTKEAIVGRNVQLMRKLGIASDEELPTIRLFLTMPRHCANSAIGEVNSMCNADPNEEKENNISHSVVVFGAAAGDRGSGGKRTVDGLSRWFVNWTRFWIPLQGAIPELFSIGRRAVAVATTTAGDGDDATSTTVALQSLLAEAEAFEQALTANATNNNNGKSVGRLMKAKLDAAEYYVAILGRMIEEDTQFPANELRRLQSMATLPMSQDNRRSVDVRTNILLSMLT